MITKTRIRCRYCKDTGMVTLATTSKPCLDCVAGRAGMWLAGNDTGISSRTIHNVLRGQTKPDDGWGWSAPWDADDFGRCARLIDLIPEWEDRIHEVADMCRSWRPIADCWDELKALYDAGRIDDLDVRVRELRSG